MVAEGIHASENRYGKLDTIAVHGSSEAKTNGAAVLPVHNSVTYGVRGEYQDGSAFYTRPADTPNHAVRSSHNAGRNVFHAIVSLLPSTTCFSYSRCEQ